MGQYALGMFATGRKKLFLGAILILAALAGIVIFAFKTGFFTGETVVHNSTIEEQAQVIAGLAMKEALKDTDNDGLKDWEEAIYRTNPESKDTDGDGTSDSEEIRQNRDPLKKGPDDKTFDPTSDAPQPSALDVDPKNVTQNLTKALFESGAFSAIDTSGNLTSTDFLSKLNVPDSLSAKNLFANIPFVTKSDLVITETSDPTAIRNYFTTVVKIYQTTLGSFPESDILIFTNALENSAFASLKKLDEQASAIGRVASEIQKLPVPAMYADGVIQEIHDLREIQRAMELMRNVEADPLAGYFAFQRRLQLIDEMSASSAKRRDQLVKDGVITL